MWAQNSPQFCHLTGVPFPPFFHDLFHGKLSSPLLIERTLVKVACDSVPYLLTGLLLRLVPCAPICFSYNSQKNHLKLSYDLFFSSLTLSSHSGFLTILQTHHARILLRAFAPALPSSWNSFLRYCHASLTSLRPLLQCPLPRRPTLTRPLETVPLHFLILLFHLSSQTLPDMWYWFLFLSSPHPRPRMSVPRELFCSLQYLAPKLILYWARFLETDADLCAAAFLGHVCRSNTWEGRREEDWEEVDAELVSNCFRVCILRTGIVFGLFQVETRELDLCTPEMNSRWMWKEQHPGQGGFLLLAALLIEVLSWKPSVANIPSDSGKEHVRAGRTVGVLHCSLCTFATCGWCPKVFADCPGVESLNTLLDLALLLGQRRSSLLSPCSWPWELSASSGPPHYYQPLAIAPQGREMARGNART